MPRANVLHFEPGAYLPKTRRLSLDARGAYSDLLFTMWEFSDEQCIFPLDCIALSGIWGVNAERAVDLIDEIQRPGMPLLRVVKRHGIDHLLSSRLQSQKKKAEAFRAAQSEKGKRSGAARREKAVNPGSTPVKPRFTPDTNPAEPSYLVDPYLVDPCKPPKTLCAASYPQADPNPALCQYAEKVGGRDLTADEERTIRRWVLTYDEGPVREEIGACFEARNTGDIDVKKPLAYIETQLKKRATTGGAS